MGVTKATLERAFYEITRDLADMKKTTKKIIDILERIYEATRDRDYLTYVDRANKILREINELKDDIEYEIQIL